MKKFFIILLGIIVVTAMVGCLNLTAIPPFLNSAPVMISEPIITATEDQLYLYQVEASDPNGDTLIYSFIIKPEGMSIDNESGLISWTPANNQVGIHQVVVEISDGKHSVSQRFKIEVFNVNNPPQISSYFPANLNFEINEGSSIKFEVQTNDIDLNTTLSFQWFLNGKLVLDFTVSRDGSKSSWIYSASYGDYGQKIVKVLVSDGELQDYVQWNITINDITPPAQPTLNTVTSPTNISSQTLYGTKEPNTSIWVNGAEVISINSDTTWSYSLHLTEGTNSIFITSCDTAGNESSSVSTTIVLDISTPEIPTLNDVISPTNISPQILSGTKEANSSILINGTEVISINSSINWSYSHNLFEGINNISVTSRDAVGNESSAVTAIIILDTINPAAPTLDAAVSPTNISPQTLSGAKEANTSIWINNLEVVPINSSTTWTYDFNLSEGENNISINSRDAVSNESAVVNNSITLDTIPPTTPILHDIISPANICIQLLSGNKEINSSIWVNGVEVISVNSKTTWSYDFELIEGENSISIISKDIVGNESNEINTTVILDISAPAIPSLEPVSSPTNISSQTLSGTKEANTSIWVNGAEVISINSDTTWSHPYSLSEGTNNISITSRDAAGNESLSIATNIILDTISPMVPTLNSIVSPTNISAQILGGTKEADTSILINGVEVIPINSETTWSYSLHLTEGTNSIFITSCDTAGNESSSVSTTIVLDISTPEIPTLNDVISPTNISPQILSGTKEINSSILINSAEVISLNSSTNWSHSHNLFEGINNISITSRDAAGNESSAVTAIIILDTINPGAPTLDATVSPTNISPQTLSGSKEANTSVWINNLEVVPINSSTTWTYDFNLSEGENNISINSRDAVGSESAVVNNSITLDTIPPTTPILHDIISPTNICIQLLSGNKEINSSIWVNGVEVISVNSETTWSYDFDLIEGENSISIISKDIVGNESNEINTTVILDISAPAIPSLEPVSSPTNISSQTLSGTKEANTSIWINGTEVVPLNSSTDWSYSYNLSEGNNNISVTSRDAAGNESSAVTATIEYDPNIYVDAANATGIEDGTKIHPFSTITEGIIAVAPEKSVMVAVGNYNEQLVISKEITLQGASRDNTFITGSGLTGNLITLEADYVTITGFTIDGASSTAKGIYFNNYSSININNNIIQNNTSYGINYINSSPTIENNDIKSNNYSGIDAGTGGAGIIRNNFVVSNKYGIRTNGDSSPEITRNNISNNNTGIYCRESATPIISYNTISNNSGYGILIDNILGNLVNPDIGGGDGQSDGQNKITGNSIHGVSNKTTHNIMALNNWWGDAAGPKYPGNNSSSGDWAYWDNVNNKAGAIKFDPYLKEPQTL